MWQSFLPAAGAFVAALGGTLIGHRVQIRWRGDVEGRHFLRAQRLEAYVAFAQALDRLQETADPIRAGWPKQQRDLERKFLEGWTEFDRAGTRVQFLCGPETTELAGQLHSLWGYVRQAVEFVPHWPGTNWDQVVLDHRKGYGGFINAGRLELELPKLGQKPHGWLDPRRYLPKKEATATPD